MAGPPHSSTPSCSCGQQTARNPRNKSQLRAAFSSGNNTSYLGKKGNASSPIQPAISKHFTRRPIQGLVSTQHGSVLPVYSSSTYRDEGALSEVAIADCLCEQLPHSSTADVQAGSAQTQLVTSSAPNVHKKGSLSEETARRRQQRSCYPAPYVDTYSNQYSNFLERRPKVQVPSRLQGCVTEVVPQAHSLGDTGVLDGEAQLALWFQYSAALNATAVSHALHSKLGRKAASSQLAAALSLPSSAAVARLLAEGKSAKLQLVAANIGLVRKLAHDYKQKNEVPFQDLVQAGLWGLDRGLSKYDPTRGAKLSTALYWYIRDAIFKTYRLEAQMIHIPLTTQEQMDKLRKALGQYQQQHPGQSPSLEYLKKTTGLGKLAVQRVLQVNALSEYSLDALAGQGGSHSYANDDNNSDTLLERLAGSDEEAERMHTLQLLHMDLKVLLTALPDPMGVIMQEKYGLLDGHAKTFEEVDLSASVNDLGVSCML
ncbi:TPA: hypothetical protein ACH3X2_006968 [Trebouxia sp. C0005]